MTYLDGITGGMNPREIAKATGVPYSNIYRLTTTSKTLDVKVIVEICRAFNAPLLPAFVAAGFITEDEARQAVGAKGLDLATDDELAQEAVRRMGQGRSVRSVLNEPLDNVTPLHREGPIIMAARKTSEPRRDDEQ